MATRRRKRLSRGVKHAEEDDTVSTEEQPEISSSSEEKISAEEDAPSQSTETKKEESQDEQDSQMNADIKVKGNSSTVTVTWAKKTEEEKQIDEEKRTSASDQVDTDEIIVPPADEKSPSEDAPTDSMDTTANQEVLEPQESQMDTVENTEEKNATPPVPEESQIPPPVTDESEVLQAAAEESEIHLPLTEENEIPPPVTEVKEILPPKSEESEIPPPVKEEHETAPPVTVKEEREGESMEVKQTDEGGEVIKEVKSDKSKRKAQPMDETSPSKKTKLINDGENIDKGFCIFVGNLNNSKKSEEVKAALANYLMAQSILVQDIRLNHSKKHAHIDLASQMDVTKALTLDGEMVLEKPMKIAKAKVKVKSEDKDKEEVPVEDKKDKSKRKAQPMDETLPSKKTKLINDGFCIFVGNLNNSKKSEKVKAALANYLMAQSILVQDIRLNHSKKHAHIDLASQMDVTKALTLDGEMVLERPMKIAKAKVKVKSEEKDKEVVPVEDKKAAKDARCLFLKNVPYSATKEDILKIFQKAVTVRFPGGANSPNKGIAFVEFQSKGIAQKFLKRNQVVRIQERVLIVNSAGPREVSKAEVTKDDKKHKSKAAVPPNKTLFVAGLSVKVNEKHLKKVFQKAVGINAPRSQGKSKGYAFVDFASVADAEKALKSSKNTKVCKRPIRVEFSEMRPEKEKVQSKTLMVIGLAEKTTADTLKKAFDGALSARVIMDRETGISKGFGFVDFESEVNSKAVKEAMEDCEIDGSHVTLDYAKPKGENLPFGVKRDPVVRLQVRGLPKEREEVKDMEIPPHKMLSKNKK